MIGYLSYKCLLASVSFAVKTASRPTESILKAIVLLMCSDCFDQDGDTLIHIGEYVESSKHGNTACQQISLSLLMLLVSGITVMIEERAKKVLIERLPLF